jgi:hypothetical protein
MRPVPPPPIPRPKFCARLSPDQTEQLVRASADGGILGRCCQALPEGSEIERDDLELIARFLRGLAEPYPYLYAIAYGT